MAVLLRARSSLNPPGTPILVVTFRLRECRRCGKRTRVTLFSPSTFYGDNIRAGLMAAFGKAPGETSDGQCCIRCTRELRSP